MTDDLAYIAEALPDYDIERELGRGGMGVVLLGQHRRLGRDVAIKELPQAFATEPDIRARFTREARTLATLAHPHIVPVYDYVERGPLCLIVMEQLPGGTVWERFTTVGLTAPAACAITLGCCAALQHAHDKGVLHLDVKPDNLMFDVSGTVKVTDFGISRVISGDRLLATVDGQVLGTPAYMSPEQAAGEELDGASDIYSAGVMLYELLSGRLPWSGAENASELLAQRLEEAPKPLREVAPHVPAPVAAVVMQAIERERSHRYSDAEEMGVALASACADAWGPAWLDHAGIALIGSDRLSIAARTTNRGGSQSPSPAAPATQGTAGTASPGTVVAPGQEARGVADTVHSGGLVGEAQPAPATVGPGVTATPAGATETGVSGGPAPVEDAPALAVEAMPVMRAAAAEPRIRGADLNVLGRNDLLEMREALKPPRFPRWSLLLAVGFLIAAAIACFVMSGASDPEGDFQAGQVLLADQDVATVSPVEIDLSQDITVVVAAPVAGAPAPSVARLSMSLLGLPLGSLDTKIVDGKGVFEPGTAAHLGSGDLTAKLTLSAAGVEIGSERFDVEATNPWWATALGIVGIVLILAGLANLESNLRKLRQRRRFGAVVGAALAGFLVGVGAIGTLTAAGLVRPSLVGTVVTVVFNALAFVFGGIALGALSRRRRVNKAVKRGVRTLGVEVVPD